MVVTTIGKRNTAYLIGGSSITPPAYMVIGSGSGTELSSIGSLYNEYTNQRKVFTSTDLSTSRQIEWQTDWGATTMSGLSLTEFGLESTTSGTDLWHYENLSNAVNFDGSNELRIILTWEVY